MDNRSAPIRARPPLCGSAQLLQTIGVREHAVSYAKTSSHLSSATINGVPFIIQQDDDRTSTNCYDTTICTYYPLPNQRRPCHLQPRLNHLRNAHAEAHLLSPSTLTNASDPITRGDRLTYDLTYLMNCARSSPPVSRECKSLVSRH